MTQLKINGKQVEVSAGPDTPLLWVIRDEIGLTGTKFGCGAPVPSLLAEWRYALA